MHSQYLLKAICLTVYTLYVLHLFRFGRPFDPEFGSKFGVADYDWSNMKSLWANKHPMNCEADLLTQANLNRYHTIIRWCECGCVGVRVRGCGCGCAYAWWVWVWVWVCVGVCMRVRLLGGGYCVACHLHGEAAVSDVLYTYST